ncbi:hypothetical protein SDC9_202222 [bioreactor metagenome]|uniref:Uncharacterized protein n=1 Tax=bioreactor metagenome TaxID=1076179 RepID=A0A645IT35_9ZZZZ
MLADGDFVALGDEPGDIRVGGVVGHPAHGGAFLLGLVPIPGGEGEIQLPGGQKGVLVEHLIKISQPEEKQAVGMALLNLLILTLHGGELSHKPASLQMLESKG